MELIALGSRGRGGIVSPLDERRQRAREAAQDAHGDPQFFKMDAGNATEAAIEAATRVKITDEAVALAVGADRDHFAVPYAYATTGVLEQLRRNLTAALEELGFEVEQ